MEAVKAFCEDGGEFEATYAVWESNAEESIRDMKRDGYTVVKIDFDLNEFKAGCVKHQRPSTGDSRSKYTVFKRNALPDPAD